MKNSVSLRLFAGVAVLIAICVGSYFYHRSQTAGFFDGQRIVKTPFKGGFTMIHLKKDDPNTSIAFHVIAPYVDAFRFAKKDADAIRVLNPLIGDLIVHVSNYTKSNNTTPTDCPPSAYWDFLEVCFKQGGGNAPSPDLKNGAVFQTSSDNRVYLYKIYDDGKTYLACGQKISTQQFDSCLMMLNSNNILLSYNVPYSVAIKNQEIRCVALNMVAAAWSDKIYEPNDICLRKS